MALRVPPYSCATEIHFAPGTRSRDGPGSGPCIDEGAGLPLVLVHGFASGRGDAAGGEDPGTRHVVVPGNHLSVFQFSDYVNAVQAFLRDVSPLPA